MLKSDIDKNTGAIIDQEKYRRTSKSKGGWSRMYKKDYLSSQEDCIKSTTDLKIWNYIVDSTNSNFSFSLNITKLSKKLGVSRQKVHQSIKRMIDNSIIRKTDDGYEFNPFIYCPFGANDDMVFEKQDEWKRRGDEQ